MNEPLPEPEKNLALLNPNGFKKYFSLEEAVALLPEVTQALQKAHAEMNELRDDVILYKRIMIARQKSGKPALEDDGVVLHEKFETYEQTCTRWEAYFTDRGIIMRDLETGLIDFPYHSGRTGQDYFLCWRLPEEGIFYFHTLHDGFSGRYPISLLPE